MFDREGLQYLTDNRRNKQDPFAVIRFLKNDSFSEYINQGAIESAVIQTIACEPIVSIVSTAGEKAYYSIKPPRVNGALSNVSEANSRFPLVFFSLSLFSLIYLLAILSAVLFDSFWQSKAKLWTASWSTMVRRWCACGIRTCIDHFRSRARSKGIGCLRSSSPLFLSPWKP